MTTEDTLALLVTLKDLLTKASMGVDEDDTMVALINLGKAETILEQAIAEIHQSCDGYHG